MRRYRSHVGMMFWIVAGFCNLFCQLPDPQSPPVDPRVYEQFFAQFVGIKHVIDSQSSAVNGQLSTITAPNIEKTIGLTHHEVAAVNASALDCLAQMRRVDDAIKPLIFDSRIQAIQFGESVAWITLRLKDLNTQRTTIIVDHVQQLKIALGDASFQKLDAYVRSKKDTPYFSLAPKR
jgi:hypothetical protein